MADALSSQRSNSALWREYLELCKPKVVLLIVFTALVGMFMAVPEMVPLHILVFGNLGIGLAAASAAAINHVMDARIDAAMKRTEARPLPTGQVTPIQAWIFAFVLGSASMLILSFLVNPLTAILTFGSLIGYAVIYTMYLKRATPQNIVIGGAAGAAPPVLGWTAVTGQVEANALLLFLLIFVWTPPHFWALAVHRRHDYANAEIPMLPVTHGPELTRLHILLYIIALLAVSVLPYLTTMSGLIYLVGALLLGGRFLYWGIRLYRYRDDGDAFKTFTFSIFYLTALFALLLVDHYFKFVLALGG